MKNYSNDELMIEIRKKAEKHLPKPGELVQGVFFAMNTSLQHLKGANVLFEQKLTISAYGVFILALEELGKINRFAEVLISWSSPEKSEEYKSRQKDHPWKLSGALGMFAKLIKTQGTSLKVTGIIQEWLDGGDPIEFMLKYVNPESAKQYHQLRQDITYSNFDGQRVSSPFQHVARIEPEMCKYMVEFLKLNIEKVLELTERFLPIYTDLLKKCYYENDSEKITSLKLEINRRVRRTMPAVRKYADKWLLENTGYDIEYWSEQPQSKMQELFQQSGSNITEHIQKISELIVGNDFIEDVYYYPPLKELAKDYYAKVKTD